MNSDPGDISALTRIMHRAGYLDVQSESDMPTAKKYYALSDAFLSGGVPLSDMQ